MSGLREKEKGPGLEVPCTYKATGPKEILKKLENALDNLK